jgi:hypothetical protein
MTKLNLRSMDIISEESATAIINGKEYYAMINPWEETELLIQENSITKYIHVSEPEYDVFYRLQAIGNGAEVHEVKIN